MYQYRIASFNLYKFSKSSNKELSVIADIIKNNHVDILAIQEIFSKDALDNLLIYLGKDHWDGAWASPDSRSASAAEGYAYIWFKDRIILPRNRYGKIFKPTIHKQYTHKDVDLIRDPFYGRFLVKSNQMIEFRLINTHIMFSLNKEENESEDHESNLDKPGAVEMRNKEFEVLASKILPKLQNKDYDSLWDEVDEISRSSYTFLLGDYNLNLRSSAASGSILQQPFIYIRDGIDEKEIITIQKDLTTLRGTSAEHPVIDGYRNNFDHFTYDAKRPVETRAWAVDVPNRNGRYHGDYEKYKKEISDHLMVIMEVSFI